jgi:hypothetical protein
LLARCFAELFYNPENGGDTFLRNVGYHSTHYTASYPRRKYSTLLNVLQTHEHKSLTLLECTSLQTGQQSSAVFPNIAASRSKGINTSAIRRGGRFTSYCYTRSWRCDGWPQCLWMGRGGLETRAQSLTFYELHNFRRGRYTAYRYCLSPYTGSRGSV